MWRNTFFRKIFLSIALIFISLYTSCAYFAELHQQRDRAVTDLDAICQKIPIPKDFAGENSQRTIDIAKVAFFRSYRTIATCKTVGNHFKNHFIEEGWDQNLMKTSENYGGMKTQGFDFRHGDYLVSVECQNDVNADADKKVVVSCSWGLR